MKPKENTAPAPGFGITRRIFFVLFPLALIPVLLLGGLLALVSRGLFELAGSGASPAVWIVPLFFAVVLLAVLLWAGIRLTLKPMREIAEALATFSPGGRAEPPDGQRRDEFGQISNKLNRMAEELSSLDNSLEGKVEERTRQIRLAVEIAQAAAGAAGEAEIIEQTVRLIVDRLDFYHAAIYLIEPGGKYAELASVSGAGSGELSARGARVALGSNSIIGWVAASRQFRVASASETAPIPIQKEFMPLARSEAGFPLSSNGEILGVLNVLSATGEVFNSDSVEALQILSGLIAAALMNSRGLNSAAADLKEVSTLYQAGKSFASATSIGDVDLILSVSLKNAEFGNAFFTAEGDAFSLYSFSTRTTEEPGDHAYDPPSKITTLPPFDGLGGTDLPGVLLLDTLSEDRRYQEIQILAASLGWSSLAVLPIAVDRRVYSLIVLGAKGRNQIAEATLSPYVELVEAAVRAILDLQRRQSAITQRENLSTVVSLIQDLAVQNPGEFPVADLFASVLASFEEIFESDRAAISLLDDDGSHLELKAFRSDADEHGFQPAIPIGIYGHSVSEVGVSDWIRSLTSESPVAGGSTTMGGNPSITSFPITFRGEILGVLVFGRKHHSSATSPSEELVSAYCSALALLLANARLLHRQRKLFDVTARISRSAGLGEVLQTTVQELGGILNARRASLRVGPEDSEENYGN